MRHNKVGRRLGRNTPHRMAMMRNMVTSLIDHERITTTDTRAKELRKLADRMITLGKRGDLHARRQALTVIRDSKVVSKLFDRLGPRFQDRPGGYTRIIKLGPRLGDNAPMSVIELVEEGFTPKPRKKMPKAVKTVAPKAAEPVVAVDASTDADEVTAGETPVEATETTEADVAGPPETDATSEEHPKGA